MIGSFGNIVFETSSEKKLTFDDFERSGGNRYATHNSLGVKPKTEHIGPDLEKISMVIKLSSSAGINVERTISNIRDFRDSASVGKLILGGRVVGSGNYIIKTMSESLDIVDNQGSVLKATVNIELEEYIIDIPKVTVKAIVKKANQNTKKTANQKPIAKKNTTKKPIKSNSNKKNYGTNNPDAQAEKMAIKKSVQSDQAKYSNSNKDSLQEKISIKKR